MLSLERVACQPSPQRCPSCGGPTRRWRRHKFPRWASWPQGPQKLGKLANGKRRTHALVSTPAKDSVAPLQARKRAALATTGLGRPYPADPRLVAATFAESSQRAGASGALAVAPVAAMRTLPVRLKNQFSHDKGVSGLLWRRCRLLLGAPGVGLAANQSLRADLRAAKEDPRNAATTQCEGAFLVAPWMALQAMVGDFCESNQFIERFERGSGGAEIPATSFFFGKASPTNVRRADVKSVQIVWRLRRGEC